MALLFELVGNLSDPSSSSQGSTVSQMLQTTENELCKTVRLNEFSKTTMQSISVPFFIRIFTLVHPRLILLYLLCYLYLLLTFWAWGFFMFHPVWWQFWLNTFVTHPVSSFNQCRLILTNGRSRGGPTLIFRPNWGPKSQRAEKCFLETGPPLISRCGSGTANWHNVAKDPKYLTALRTRLKRGTFFSLQVYDTMKG